MDLAEGRYRIPIDGRWDLEDLYRFPRTYEQVYYLIYSLLSHEDEWIEDRIVYAFAQYPWRGGYSAVNFYNKLKFTVPKEKRPQVLSLQYESPGWIELGLIVSVAVTVERLIKAIASILREANTTYHEVHKGLEERRLLRIEVEMKQLELERTHLAFIHECNDSMVRLLGLDNVDLLHARTESPLVTLKILLSLYRRVRTLVEYQRQGKAKF